MKTILYPLFAIIFAAGLALGQSDAAGVVRVEADPARGFDYPFYLYVPPGGGAGDAAKTGARSLLVVPNNTGSADDDLAVHEANVRQKMGQLALAFGRLDVPALMPVFPRPKTDWKIYTHALDRDSLTTDKAAYRRFDRQLAAMIAAARARLAEGGVRTDPRVLMYGFSAAGMFVNRFAFLHPEMVRAVAAGSPGGWPLAPVEKHAGRALRYPVGVADLKAVAGAGLDAENVRQVEFFFFMGDKDENDSVVFEDGYEEADRKLVFELFGATPRARWDAARKLYADERLAAEFRLYPDAAHKVTPAMIADVQAFFEKHKAR